MPTPPTIGRIVLVRTGNGNIPHVPAVVTHVWSGWTINVFAFGDVSFGLAPGPQTSLMWDGQAIGIGWWRWPQERDDFAEVPLVGA